MVHINIAHSELLTATNCHPHNLITSTNLQILQYMLYYQPKIKITRQINALKHFNISLLVLM